MVWQKLQPIAQLLTNYRDGYRIYACSGILFNHSHHCDMKDL